MRPAALAGAASEFAALALAELDGIGARLGGVRRRAAALARTRGGDLPRPAARGRGRRTRRLARWLAAALPGLPPARPVGPEHYQWFLREVACVPLTVAEIEAPAAASTTGRSGSSSCTATANRARARAAAARQRGRAVPRRGRRRSAGARSSTSARTCSASPATLGRYLALPMPAYLEPLRFLGVADELTGPGG